VKTHTLTAALFQLLTAGENYPMFIWQNFLEAAVELQPLKTDELIKVSRSTGTTKILRVVLG